jgi:hypothetical protein
VDFNRELLVLAERSDGTREDIICEWAYAPERYPTLIGAVRDERSTVNSVCLSATMLRLHAGQAFGARIAKLAGSRPGYAGR